MLASLRWYDSFTRHMLAIFPVLVSLDLWAGWSSIVGLLLSIATVISSMLAAGRAKKAQLAAEAAAKSIRHRDTADELGLLVALAAQMSQFVEVNDGRGASLRASDVLEKLVALQNRRLPFLNGEQDRIDLIKDQLSNLSKSLATSGVPTDTSNRKKLLGRCQEVHSTLSGMAGKIQLSIEDRGNQ
jgi:hypothetical protein